MPWVMSLNELNPFTAYQFDAAVTAFGTILDNALMETVETGIGNDKRLVQKYRIDDLLDDKFQFVAVDPLAALKGLDEYDEVS